MTDWTSIDDPVDRLHSMVSGFHATYYVSTGVECGLFEALVEPHTPSDLASQLGLFEPYVRRFCEIGLRWGLLRAEPHGSNETRTERPDEKGDETPYSFSLRESFVQPLAVPEAAQYMGHLFRFVATHVSEEYADYPNHFRTGERRPFHDHDASFTTVVEGSTRGLQTIFVEKLLPESLSAFEERLSRGGRLLDIGCGTGYLANQLCDRYPNLSVVGIDLDADAIERARERASESGVADRTTFRSEDATSAVTEGDFDAIVLFMSLHEIAADKRRTVFEELDESLVEDGVITVFDEVYPAEPESFDRQPFAAGVETQWSELCWGNDVPTVAEQRELLATAGLTERFRTTFADRFVVFEGVRTNE